MKRFVFFLILPWVILSETRAQTPSVVSTTPATNPNARPVINSDPSNPVTPVVAVALAPTEINRPQLSVPFANSGPTKLKILGVQTSGPLYVADFPNGINAGDTQNIDMVYDANDGSPDGIQAVRVITDQGVKTFLVNLTRPAAVSLDTQSLTWNVGDPVTAKVITITVPSGGAIPQRVRVTGSAGTAQLTATSSTTYQVSVTPDSTAKPKKFAIFVDFDRKTPGLTPVISAQIED